MTGLTNKKAKKLLQKFGRNILEARPGTPWWEILGRQFSDLMVLILVAAAGISYGLGEEVDSIVIIGIVILNAGIGFSQEYRTEKILQALRKMIRPEITVIRDGEEKLIQTALLVPGDWVVLREGDKIPADGMLKEAHVFRANESALTGESVPVDKFKEEEVFMGTSVVHGSGIMEVVKTGMRTKFGEIARLATETEDQPSPLQKELKHIGIFVTKITGVLCLFLFGVGIWRGSEILESLLFSVSVAIAAVPEGLPTTITVALALGATVLTRRKAVVKRLSSVETLGAVTTICSDKTGTLTRNEMMVKEIYLADRSIFRVSGTGYSPHAGEITFLGGPPQTKENKALLHDLLEIGWKCNDSKLVRKHGKYTVLGDPTEGALLTLVRKYQFSREAAEDEFPFLSGEVEEIFPFDSNRKMMSVISEKEVLVKGSPDHVLERCKYWTDGKRTYPMTPQKIKKIRAHYKRMANNALRVLAFAKKRSSQFSPPGVGGDVQVNNSPPPVWGEMSKRSEDRGGLNTAENYEQNLTFIGLTGMLDPPREEVRESVENCKTAGLRIIVITGDYGATAEAISKDLGIMKEEDNNCSFTGDQVEKMTDSQLKKILTDRTRPLIFARSLPPQKMRIVSLLQEQGEIVAMTGDGVNDAPALKKADIGVAMGITGTEVSKEAATMVLTNDSFSSIVTAIEEGRRIYENLKKFVWFIFSCNIGELVVVFSAILFQFPLPLTAVLILCVDLGTDILPAIALGVDPAEKGVMKKPPRDPKSKVLNKKFVHDFLVIGFVIGATVTGAFLWTITNDGWNWGMPTDGRYFHAMTVAFTALVFVQLINAFSSRSYSQSVFTQNPFSNGFLVIAIITSVLLVLLMIYIPAFNQILKTAPLSWYDWGVVAVASIVPLFVVEGRKMVIRINNYE